MLGALDDLLENGKLRAGDLVPPGEFVPWGSGGREASARIRSELATLGRKLRVGDIAWFEIPE